VSKDVVSLELGEVICMTYSQVQIGISALLCASLGCYRILTSEHLDESMALFAVDDAGLYCSEVAEDVS
jgi:hypothetical protein